jgi:hypothetical protein
MFERMKIFGYQFLRGVEILGFYGDDLEGYKEHDQAYYDLLHEQHRRTMGTIDERLAGCYRRLGNDEKARFYATRAKERGTLEELVK